MNQEQGQQELILQMKLPSVGMKVLSELSFWNTNVAHVCPLSSCQAHILGSVAKILTGTKEYETMYV